jgi:hypothetical protein
LLLVHVHGHLVVEMSIELGVSEVPKEVGVMVSGCGGPSRRHDEEMVVVEVEGGCERDDKT